MSDLIKIEFRIEKEGFMFVDAIHLPNDHGLSNEEIEAIKQARFDAWYALVTAPVEEPPVEVLE